MDVWGVPETVTRQLEIYTPNHRINGTLVLFASHRLSDVLNAREQTVVTLKNATLSLLAGEERPAVQAESVTLNKSEMILVYGLEEEPKVEQPEPARSDLVYIRKKAHQVCLIAAGFLIRGKVHLIEELKVQEMLDTHREDFLAVTDASLSLLANAEVPLLQRNFVSVNKHRVAALYPETAT